MAKNHQTDHLVGGNILNPKKPVPNHQPVMDPPVVVVLNVSLSQPLSADDAQRGPSAHQRRAERRAAGEGGADAGGGGAAEAAGEEAPEHHGLRPKVGDFYNIIDSI